MKYKNMSPSSFSIKGVTFNPGDVKEVDGCVNAANLLPLDIYENIVPPTNSESQLDKTSGKLSKSVTSTKTSSASTTTKGDLEDGANSSK